MLSNFLNRIFNPSLTEKLYEWLITSVLRILIIAAGAFILIMIVNGVIGRFETTISGRTAGYSESETERRVKTLTSLLRSIVFIALVGIAAAMVLKELGMDISPIIAGAGILGLAVSFGGQNLFRNIISGFFVILENQIRAGDIAIINGMSGTVEEINFRTTVIRDLQCIVHVFPNGAINQLSNQSKGWSRYVIDMGVAYKENVDHVMEVLREIGDGLKKDDRFGPVILEPLEILGVDSFGDSDVVIKCMIKTQPLKQWEVGRELRRRIKNTFDQKGIEIPFPCLSMYYGEAGKPFGARLEGGQNAGAAGE
ncbi:MAG: mechanosensitive ion channel family protein [Thermodesulfobacteriota bacterium]